MIDLASVLVHALKRVAAVDRTLERGRLATTRMVGAALTRALTGDERASLGVAFYDARFEKDRPSPGLWGWERDWFALRLPTPPARILLGGAGGGREAIPLAAGGLRVDAFEPAPRFAASLAARLGTRGRALRASYEELADAVLDDTQGPAVMFARETYDAVVFGWGSLTHVVSPRDRERALRAADRLCPSGPILASFWLSSTDRPFSYEGRAGAIGHRLGDGIGKLRGLTWDREPECVLGFEYGFAHVFTRDEIEALATSIGRKVIWEPAAGGYPHVTLPPR